MTTPVESTEWDEFVEGHSEATGYHLWQWREIFSQVFAQDCEYLTVRRQGRIAGVLPLVFLKSWLFGRYGISLPFVNYGGVLANDQDAADELLAAASEKAAARGLAHLELRHARRQFPHLPVKQHKVRMLLPLASSAEEMWEGLDRKVRNQIRKAEKSGLEGAAGGHDLLDAFYGVFARNMRDMGIPVHSRKFFETVLHRFPTSARVCVVRLNGEPVAAGITYRYRDMLEVPWASSLKKYLALSPNNLLYWSVIGQAIRDGVHTLDFGRSTPDEGTFHFKRQWGAVPHPLFWEYRLLTAKQVPDQNPKNPKFQLAIRAWKRLPVPMASALGPRMVRGMAY